MIQLGLFWINEIFHNDIEIIYSLVPSQQGDQARGNYLIHYIHCISLRQSWQLHLDLQWQQQR